MRPARQARGNCAAWRPSKFVFVETMLLLGNGQWRSIFQKSVWTFAFQDEMANALATMRVDYDQVTPIKNLDTANNKLLQKRRKQQKSVEPVKWRLDKWCSVLCFQSPYSAGRRTNTMMMLLWKSGSCAFRPTRREADYTITMLVRDEQVSLYEVVSFFSFYF